MEINRDKNELDRANGAAPQSERRAVPGTQQGQANTAPPQRAGRAVPQTNGARQAPPPNGARPVQGRAIPRQGSPGNQPPRPPARTIPGAPGQANPGGASPVGANPNVPHGAEANARPAGARPNPAVRQGAVRQAPQGAPRPQGTVNPQSGVRPAGAVNPQGANARPAGMPGQQSAAAHPAGTPNQQNVAARPNGTPNQPNATARPNGTPNQQNATAHPNGTPNQPNTTAHPNGTPNQPNTTAHPNGTPDQQNAAIRPTDVPQSVPVPKSDAPHPQTAPDVPQAPSLLRANRTATESAVDLPVPDKNRTSALRPTAPIDAPTDTRVIPAQGRADKKDADGKSKKKQKKDSPMRERLREEGNNAVMSLVKAAIYLVCVLLVSTIISVSVIMVGNDVFAFVKSDDPVNVVIPENANLEQISEILAENGIIKYPSIFKWYAEDEDAEYGDNAGIFVAGTYELRASMDYEDLLASFKPKRPSGTSWITFPEGYTTDEIIDLLIDSGIGSIDIDEKDPLYDYYSQYSDLREAYEGVINDYDFNYWFVDELEENGYSDDRFYRLDGYLFPDTYEFYNASKPHIVINKMLARFSQIFTEEYRALAEQGGHTVDEIVILASMVEKEANNPADYFNVSEVFHNRLTNPAAQNTYTLDSDATVLYHIHHTTGERPTTTTREDTQMDVPYNTYINQGLPPGAISNPSATAILAALNPSKNGYYFFITGNLDTYFSVNYDQHQTWIWRITNGQA